MADNKNNFDGTIQSLFGGMSELLTTKTVVGEAVHIDDTIILPLVDVSFGVGAGARKDNGGSGKDTAQGGAGVKMSPSAILVIHNGSSRLVNIKNQDTVAKLVDMIPDLIDRLKKEKEDAPAKEMTDQDIIDAAAQIK